MRQLMAEDKLTETAYRSPVGPIAPIYILYGHRASLARGNLYMAHRCGFTQKVLVATLQAAGFAPSPARRAARRTLISGRWRASGVVRNSLSEALIDLSTAAGVACDERPTRWQVVAAFSRLGGRIVAPEVAPGLDDFAQLAVQALDGMGGVDQPTHRRREGKERDHPLRRPFPRV